MKPHLQSNSLAEKTARYLAAERAAKDARTGNKWRRQIQLELANRDCLKAEVEGGGA